MFANNFCSNDHNRMLFRLSRCKSHKSVKYFTSVDNCLFKYSTMFRVGLKPARSLAIASSRRCIQTQSLTSEHIAGLDKESFLELVSDLKERKAGSKHVWWDIALRLDTLADSLKPGQVVEVRNNNFYFSVLKREVIKCFLQDVFSS